MNQDSKEMNKRLISLLKRVQWCAVTMYHGDEIDKSNVCPICEGWYLDGHKEDCELNLLLNKG